nr:putative phage internal virion protein D [uncultured Mediterranean phage uvMED]
MIFSTRSIKKQELPRESPTFWKDVGSSYKYSYLPLIKHIERQQFGQEDPEFNVTNEMLMDQPIDLIPQLLESKNENEFYHRIQSYDDIKNVKEELGINNSFMASLFAGVFDPINLLPVPALKGVGFVRGVKRGIVSGLGIGTVSESLRAPFDPTNTHLETALNVGGATFFGGMFGGGIGHLTRKKAGKDFAEQSGIDDNMPGFEDLVERKKINNSEGLFEIKKEKPQSLADSYTQFYRDNNFFRREDKLNLSNKDLEAKPADSFGYAELTMPATPFGRVVLNYQSNAMLKLASGIAGDGGIKFKTNESGISLMPEGSILLNKGRWDGIASVFELEMQNLYVKQFGIENPANIATQNFSYTGFNIASKFNKKLPSPIKFFEDVGEYVNREGADPNFKPNMETPYDKAVVEASEKFKSIMKNAENEGYKVGFFKNFKTANKRLEQTIDKDVELDGIVKDLQKQLANAVKLKKPTGKIFAKLGNAHLYLTQNRSQRKLLESQLYRELKKIGRAEKTLDDIIDKAIARKTKAQNLIEDIDNKVNTYIYKTKNYPKIQKELDQQSREAYRADVDLLKEIYRKQANKRSYNFFAGQTKGNTLSDAQVKFTRDLWDRIKAYHETPRGNLSKAKQNYFKQIDEILYNPYTDGQIALMKRLLKQIETPLSPNELAYGRVLKGQLANFNYSKVVDDVEKKGIYDSIGTAPNKEKNKTNYFTRVWQIDAIKDNEKEFLDILRNYYMENPSGFYMNLLKLKQAGKKLVVRGKFRTDRIEVTDEVLATQLNKQVDETYANIVVNAERQNLDNIHGSGLKKIQMSRDLTIPNYQLLASHNGVADFIEKNSVSVMRQYMQKFGPTFEATRLYKGERNGFKEKYEAFDDVIEKYGKEFDANPTKELKKMAKHRDDLNELENVVLNRIPEGYHIGSTSNRLIRAGMNLSTITMMGSAALASLADPAKVILSRGFKQTFGRYVGTWMADLAEKEMLSKGNKFLTSVTGEGLEVISGAGMSRMQEVGSGIGEINNRKLGGFGDKVFEWLDKTAGKFYNINLLNHWTASNKRLVMPMAVDRIIRVGAILNNEYKGNKIPLQYFKKDKDILLSYGLTDDDLKGIHKAWQRVGGDTRARGKEIFYDNSEAWAELHPRLFRKYTSAIRADILFTIITPTEADKPLLSHGIFKGSRWSQGMKDRQHNVFKLPVQFMSWAFGANNKIVISGLQGRHQGYFSGMMSMFAMGMLSDYIRNPEWWKYKSTDERIIKAVEYSGLTAYLLDISNFAEVVSNNGIGLRPLYGKENPFTGKTRDQISEFGGPLGSIMSDAYGMFFDEQLEQRDKVRMMRRMIPFNNVLYVKWLFNMAQRSIQDPRTQSFARPLD